MPSPENITLYAAITIAVGVGLFALMAFWPKISAWFERLLP